MFGTVVAHSGDLISDDRQGEENPEREELVALGDPDMDPSSEIVEVTVKDEERAQAGIGNNIQENEEKETENLENTHEFTIENMRFPVSPGSSDDDRMFFTPVEQNTTELSTNESVASSASTNQIGVFTKDEVSK